MKQITVKFGQSIYDIAVQYYGCTDGVWLLMEDNPVLQSITDIPTACTLLLVRFPVPKLARFNQRTAADIEAQNIEVAGGFNNSVPPTPLLYVNELYVEEFYIN